MSVFNDIWISNRAKPNCRRIDNGAWTQDDNLSANIWFSTPHHPTDYLQKYTNSVGEIIVIGQFYEKVVLSELLERCLKYIDKTSAFLDPAGHYLIIVHHKVKQEYHLFTNRLGTYHAYWSSVDNINTLSTYYIGLAKSMSGKRLDWEGITGFMAMGYFPGTTTYLEGISVLQPASHYIFNENLDLLNQETYWEWNYTPCDIRLSELHEEFRSILSTSLSTALSNKRVALPISGGLDSRLLAGEVTKNNIGYKSLWGYSYGYIPQSKETKIASEIAGARKIDFDAYVMPNYLFDNINYITDSVELFQYIDGTRQACMREQLESHGDIVLAGHWGDVWMNDSGTEGMSVEDYFNKKIVKRGSDWLLKEVTGLHYPKYAPFLKNYFNGWNDKYRNIEEDFRMKIFKTSQWSFRWTLASVRMYQAAVMPVLTFYDNRIVDFFSKVQGQVLKGRHFEIEFIKSYHPDLAKIKWQEYDRNLYDYKKFNNRNVIYRGLKKLQITLTNEKPILRNWEVFYLNPDGRKNLEQVLVHNKPFNEIVPTEKIKELLDDFYEYPNAANGYKISQLHTLAQFMKLIF